MDLSAKDDALQIDCNACVFGDHRLELCYRQPRLYRIGVCLAVERLDLCAHPTRVRSCRLPRAFENAVALRTERKMQRTWTQGTLSSMGASGCKGAGPASGAPASSPQLGACDISRRSWMSLSQRTRRIGVGEKERFPPFGGSWCGQTLLHALLPCPGTRGGSSWLQCAFAIPRGAPTDSEGRLPQARPAAHSRGVSHSLPSAHLFSAPQ